MKELKELFKTKLKEIIPLLAQECNINSFSVIRWFYTKQRPARRYFLKLPSIVLETPLFSAEEKREIMDGLMQLYNKYYTIKGRKKVRNGGNKKTKKIKETKETKEMEEMSKQHY